MSNFPMYPPPESQYGTGANAPQPTAPPKKQYLSNTAIILFVAIGSALLIAGWAGMEWASLHEPTLANALSGRQLYSDAGVIRVLSVVGFLAGIASIAYPIIRAVRGK